MVGFIFGALKIMFRWWQWMHQRFQAKIRPHSHRFCDVALTEKITVNAMSQKLCKWGLLMSIWSPQFKGQCLVGTKCGEVRFRQSQFILTRSTWRFPARSRSRRWSDEGSNCACQSIITHEPIWSCRQLFRRKIDTCSCKLKPIFCAQNCFRTQGALKRLCFGYWIASFWKN